MNEIPKDDYKVDVGSGQCDIIELKQDVLQCMPPQKEPQPDENTPSHEHLIAVCRSILSLAKQKRIVCALMCVCACVFVCACVYAFT